MHGIIRGYLENLHSNKLENLEEIEQFLDTYDKSKLNKEDIIHLNRCITHKEIEATIKMLPPKKVTDLIDLLLNSTRPLKKKQ
jgi:hypothetical protein